MDIVHGAVWKEHSAYLRQRGNLALSLNADWFQPCDTNYSSGALYLTILNLPREIRNLPENIIVVALIPGMFSFHSVVHKALVWH